nr:hypothetical protein GCM10020092_104920 [Actinoplanes digitatis]
MPQRGVDAFPGGGEGGLDVGEREQRGERIRSHGATVAGKKDPKHGMREAAQKWQDSRSIDHVVPDWRAPSAARRGQKTLSRRVPPAELVFTQALMSERIINNREAEPRHE